MHTRIHTRVYCIRTFIHVYERHDMKLQFEIYSTTSRRAIWNIQVYTLLFCCCCICKCKYLFFILSHNEMHVVMYRCTNSCFCCFFVVYLHIYMSLIILHDKMRCEMYRCMNSYFFFRYSVYIFSQPTESHLFGICMCGVWVCMFVCVCEREIVCVCGRWVPTVNSLYFIRVSCACEYVSVYEAVDLPTEWQRHTECLKLQVSFRKTATNYRALLQKMTYKDKASCDSQEALRCRSFFAKEPLTIGLFRTKWPVKIRHRMGLRHLVLWVFIW